ncbi:MAG: trypsin-like peptidase domain-containing protein [Terrimicrobiaceae bacterium]|nr:trypsin-like peptidase domain-containing protein [Terrimicrobiaceae bacterium]
MFLRVFLVATAAGAGLLCAQTVPAPADRALVRQLNDSFADVFEKVAPSVVVIESQREGLQSLQGLPRGLEFFLRRPDGSMQRAEPNVGSGFIFRPDGYILTNFHVIDEAAEIAVRLRDGRKFPAEVIGVDDRTDLAVLKIAAEGLPAAELGNSEAVRVGQFAFAIGTPMELPYTFTVGVVSAKERSLSHVYGELIQTDASINPGNSGGPLSDIDGRVIGVNTLISGMNRGLGFAIPINLARNIAEQLVADGRVRRPWLGISIAGVSEDLRFQRLFPDLTSGVVVQGIEPGAPAQGSDLRPGDVILAVDGVKVDLAGDLQKQILSKQIGQTVQLEVWRQGKRVSLGVATGEMPDFQQASMRPRPNPVVPPSVPEAVPQPSSPGMKFQDASPESLKEFGLRRQEAGGVLVTEVEEGSVAAVAGLEPGDVITEAGGQPILRSQDLESVLTAGPGNGNGILLLVDRRGSRTFAILKP